MTKKKNQSLNNISSSVNRPIPKTSKVLKSRNLSGYTCGICNKTFPEQQGNFYKSPFSTLYIANNNYFPYCVNCLLDIFIEYQQNIDLREAIIAMCALTDIYYSDKIFYSIKNIYTNPSSAWGSYIRQIQNVQYKNKTFINSIRENALAKGTKVDFFADESERTLEAKEQREVERLSVVERVLPEDFWTEIDRKNKDRIVNVVFKYDPFEELDVDDRKYAYNLCSDYLQDESILEDPHKLQGVVEIVKTYIQLNKINSALNKELIKCGDEESIEKLTTVKKKLMDLINSFAKENGLSLGTNKKNTKNNNSLSFFVKELETLHFTDAEVNLFDIKTCEAMRQIADASNKSILSQIRLSKDEFNALFETQTRELQQAKAEILELKEKNRLLERNKYIGLDTTEYTVTEDKVI